MAVMGLLLTTIMFFSNCKKSDSSDLGSPTQVGTLSKDSTTLLAVSSTEKVSISLNGIKSDGGYAYKVGYPLPISGDTQTEPTKSTLRLFENGVELVVPHSVHQDIRTLGKGRFSHWGTALYFSASDNSNPSTNGRTYTYTTGLTDGTILPGDPTPIASPTSTTTTINTGDLVGFAAVNGITTGGKGGTEITVSTLAALKSAVAENAAKIIYISGTIKGAGNEPIYVKSNKSIIGKSGATIEGAQLFIYGINNVIVQNIIFKNFVTEAGVQIKEKAHHIWVDHCEFSTDLSQHTWGYWGKAISITRESDFVTVSWSKFHDLVLAVLISGGVEGHEADKGKLNVTMHHNMFSNVSEREPSMNWGRVHMFNNYHLNNNGYSIGVRAGGIIRTDNEYFSACHQPISTQVAQDPDGYISGLSTNIYDNCGANRITTTESTWIPDYEYKSALNDAKSVPSIVMNGSGPK